MPDNPDLRAELGDLDPTLLARYLTGEASREEAEEVERWIAERPDRAVLVEQLREVRRIAGEVEQESYDVEAAWHKMRGTAPAAAARPPLRLVVDRPSAPMRVARRLAVAASLLIAVGAGTWLAVREQGGVPAESVAYREIATRPGQRADVYLSDGTHVVLAAGSRLRFPAPLAQESREVYLEGEAVFEVTHNEDWPFLVRTAHGVTEDLGTKFSMRAFPADSTVTVAVVEGMVALRRDREPGAVLRPGDLGRLTADGRLETERGVALDRYFAWAEGRLVFTDTPLSEVLPELTRWYDLHVELADPSLAARRLTITVTTESTDELLRYIALALAVRYERQGRTVTFYPQ